MRWRDRRQEVEMVEVGWYPTAEMAEERALVALACRSAYFIDPEGGGYALFVEASRAEEVGRELAAYEREGRAGRAGVRGDPPRARVSPVSFFLYAWLLIACFLVEVRDADRWVDLGAASGERVLGAGEVWRVVTALTLHSDLSHLAANVAFGVVFAWPLAAALGSGVAWAGVLWAGAVGNWLNVWTRAEVGVQTIGASTAVFGALGLLVGCRLVEAVGRERRVRARDFLLPLGAGLALLGLLGSGGEEEALGGGRVDYMAHFWGFTCGLVGGAGLRAAAGRRRVSAVGQAALGLLSVAAVVAAWWMAVAAGV